MEVIIVILAYGIQIGAILLIAAGLAFLFCFGRTEGKRYLVCLGLAFVLVCGVLLSLAFHPIVICPEEYKAEFTEEMRKDVTASGRIYSAKIPLIRTIVVVTGIHDGTVYYSQYYFVSGRIGMSVGSDGYNCEKPMFP